LSYVAATRDSALLGTTAMCCRRLLEIGFADLSNKWPVDPFPGPSFLSTHTHGSRLAQHRAELGNKQCYDEPMLGTESQDDSDGESSELAGARIIVTSVAIDHKHDHSRLSMSGNAVGVR